jgi:hypothetical protein
MIDRKNAKTPTVMENKSPNSVLEREYGTFKTRKVERV